MNLRLFSSGLKPCLELHALLDTVVTPRYCLKRPCIATGWYAPKLASHQVNKYLEKNQFSHKDIKAWGRTSVIRSFYSNQVMSNHPGEDFRSYGRLHQTGGHLFGVFDGHGGVHCGNYVSKKLFDYIAIALLPFDVRDKYRWELLDPGDIKNLVDYYWVKNSLEIQESRGIELQSYKKDLHDFAVQTLSIDEDEVKYTDPYKQAFLRLDSDISERAKPSFTSGGRFNKDALKIASSGCCAIVAHINGVDLTVASTGDCMAYLGVQNPDGTFSIECVNEIHDFTNEKERRRIMREHLRVEQGDVLKRERLLGILAPLRAFGDVQFKWERRELLAAGKDVLPNYHTPPYLTAEPEIAKHKLRPCDKFLVLASDGLGDKLQPDEIRTFVVDHQIGKKALKPITLPKAVGEINILLKRRAEESKRRPVDSNVATHLIRQALGGDQTKVSEMLSLPRGESRHERDDITVTVIFFDSSKIREILHSNTMELKN